MMIDPFFRLLNFGIFLALAAYYVKRNLIGFIRSQLVRKKNALYAFDQEEVSLQTVQDKLHDQLQQQDALYHGLTAKIARWRQGFLAEQDMKKQKAAVVNQLLVSRLGKQREAYVRNTALRDVLPQVFNESLAELAAQFSDESRAQAFNQKAIEALKGEHEYEL